MRLPLLAAIPFVLLTACNDQAAPPTTTTVITPVATSNTFVLGATSGNIQSFDRNATNGGAVVSNLAVQGLAAGEKIVGMDVRTNSAAANNNKLFVLTNQGRLYTLDGSTGFVANTTTLRSNAATPTQSGCTPAVEAFTALNGTQFGVDFNPTADRLRVVSDSGQNLAINVDTGEVKVDCAINIVSGTAPKVPAVAYTKASAGSAAAASTAIYYVSDDTDTLYTTTAPANGAISAVGSGLGVNVGAINGFDIDDSANIGFLLATDSGSGSTAGKTFVYKIDLATGAATTFLEFSAEPVTGLAIKF